MAHSPNVLTEFQKMFSRRTKFKKQEHETTLLKIINTLYMLEDLRS
jgi:hypothetical protein